MNTKGILLRVLVEEVVDGMKAIFRNSNAIVTVRSFKSNKDMLGKDSYMLHGFPDGKLYGTAYKAALDTLVVQYTMYIPIVRGSGYKEEGSDAIKPGVKIDDKWYKPKVCMVPLIYHDWRYVLDNNLVGKDVRIKLIGGTDDQECLVPEPHDKFKILARLVTEEPIRYTRDEVWRIIDAMMSSDKFDGSITYAQTWFEGHVK